MINGHDIVKMTFQCSMNVYGRKNLGCVPTFNIYSYFSENIMLKSVEIERNLIIPVYDSKKNEFRCATG